MVYWRWRLVTLTFSKLVVSPFRFIFLDRFVQFLSLFSSLKHFSNVLFASCLKNTFVNVNFPFSGSLFRLLLTAISPLCWVFLFLFKISLFFLCFFYRIMNSILFCPVKCWDSSYSFCFHYLYWFEQTFLKIVWLI